MADVVLSADDVGRMLLYIAPGFFAGAAFRARFPQRDRPPLETLIWSVAASFPLVAVANELASALEVREDVSELNYVGVLLGSAILAGYLVAIVRSWRWLRGVLGWFGLHHQPEGSIYAQTLLLTSKRATVTVEFTNGNKLSGTPRAGPSLAEDDIDELYLTHPAWKNACGEWDSTGAGEAVIVRLSEVRTITLSEDPLTDTSTRRRIARG